MSHDPDYAQKRMIEEKRARLESQALSEKVSRLAGRMDALQETMAELRQGLRDIRENLRAEAAPATATLQETR